MSTAAEEIYERLREVEDTSLRNKLGLSSHEKECALRYEALWNEVRATNLTIRWAGSTLLIGTLGILTKILFFPS